ncbi:MAG: rod shape-determining protein MreC [Anaerolineaceae bacterium]
MKPSSPGNMRSIVIGLIVVGLLVLALGGFLTPLFSGTLGPLVAVQRWVSSRYMAIYEFVTVPRDVASLRQRNAELETEVSRLQAQVIELQQQLNEAQVLYSLLDFARTRPENQYVACSVIGRDPSPFLNYVIIDHGSNDGLRHGMPVVTEKGLVGRVDAVTASAARVQLITDPSSVVNVRFESSDSEAILTGSVTGDLTLEMVPQDLAVNTGDVILTSGLGGLYPSNIFIGQVVNVSKRETDLFQSASIQPVVDFSTLEAVLVITNFQPVDVTPLIPTTSP